MQATLKKLILIDASAYLYRAFHALPPLYNATGQPTGAIYGVINMLKRLLIEHKSDYVGVVFDAKGRTFRDDLYAHYKAHRQAMPDELVKQIEPLHAIIKAMGLPLLCIEGVEADDVMATLAKQAEQLNIATLISTGDKDLAQLVNAHITLINTMNNTLYDRAGVIKKFGVPPEKIVDYLTLLGDSSDNIPGVPQCGSKTAVKWLTHYDTLDNLIVHAAEIGGKIGEKLRHTLPALALSRQLVTVKIDVPLPFSVAELVVAAKNIPVLHQLYQALGFTTGGLAELATTTTVSTAPAVVDPVKAVPSCHYQLILTQAELAPWLIRLQQAELFAFDTETTSLAYVDAEIVGVSFAVQAYAAAYVPFSHDYPGAPTQLNRAAVLAQLKPLLESPHHKKVGQHIKFDMNVLANYGIHLQAVVFDSMLESYVYNSTASRHDMASLAQKYLHHKITSFAELTGTGKKQLTFNQVPLAAGAPYAASDADITLRLHQVLWPRLQATPRLAKVLTEIEMPLVPVLSKIECAGVLISKAQLDRLSLKFADNMAALQSQIFREAGQVFNIDSPKQLQEILFDKLGLPIGKKTAKGQASTAEAVLQELALSYPLPALIMRYRTYAKLKSTYTDKLPTLINARTGRVHTSYHQAITSTGRLSSSEPNLQNIPIRTQAGREIRQAFIAPPGYQLVSADYSQVELRIMAHLSGDRGLLTAFAQGEDIHCATAADVFDIPLLAVTSEQRRRAKAINFGLIYGMSTFGLSKQLQEPRHVAQHYIDAYFKRYPGVKTYMDNSRRHAQVQGYVETLSGRRLYLPGIHDRNKNIQQAAERAAINAPLQGTAADIIKLAMINLDRVLTVQKLDARMIMQVHDELVLEVADRHIEQVKVMVRHAMSQAVILCVPLVVDISVGLNWDAD